MMKLFVSTGGCTTLPEIEEICRLLPSEIGVELSAVNRNNVEHLLLNFPDRKFSLHNYVNFDEPFVLNLASNDTNTVRKSLELIKRNIIKQKELGQNFYSFHSGYMLEPKITELGSLILHESLSTYEIDRYYSRFIDNINMLVDFSELNDVKLYLENNVINYENANAWDMNYLMMTNPSNTRKLRDKINKKLGYLVDFGHLNVSANVEGFARSEYLELFSDSDLAYHISANDGFFDSNSMIGPRDWYWSEIHTEVAAFLTAEVYNLNNFKINKIIKMFERFTTIASYT